MKKTTLTMLACLAIAGTTYAANAEKGIKNKNLLIKEDQSKEVVEDCYYSIFVMDANNNYIGVYREATIKTSTEAACDELVAGIVAGLKQEYPDHRLKITSEYGN